MIERLTIIFVAYSKSNNKPQSSKFIWVVNNLNWGIMFVTKTPSGKIRSMILPFKSIHTS